jgi:hypothetical protein
MAAADQANTSAGNAQQAANQTDEKLDRMFKKGQSK